MVRPQNVNPSLQRQLNRWILSATVVFALVAGGISGWLTFEQARELQDHQLRQTATVVSAHFARIPAPRDDEDEHTLVLQHLGETHPRSLPLPLDLPSGFHTLSFDGEDWRVYVYRKATTQSRLAVSQRTEVRDEIAWDSSLRAAVPILLLAPLLMLMTGFALRRGFRPLRRLAANLDRRDSTQLAGLRSSAVPQEILPFIAAINRLLERLHQAMTQQRRFIADAAHELRTPVTALSLLADNLSHADTLAESRLRLQPVQEGLQHLRTLVAQLLDLARLQGQATPAHSTVDLQQVLQATLPELYPLAVAKHIDLGVLRSEPLRVQGQTEALQTLVRNALENAIRYTPNTGQVDISLFKAGEDAVLWVEDNGCGIPEEELAHVCKPFYRAANNAEAGNGLGLAISLEIAQQHAGKLTLSNRPQGGLRFEYRQAL